MKNSTLIKRALTALFFLILITSVNLYIIYFLPLEPFDELWNFQNVHKMFNHFTIYTDANVIITPIFYFLSLSFFKFFGSTIIAFRYFNIILYLIFFLLIFYIFKILKVPNHLNFIFTALAFTQSYPLVSCGANYNTLSTIFVFLGLIFYMLFYNKSYFHFLQGLLIFILFFTKQNIGVLFTISVLAFEFIYKSNWKTFFIQQLKKATTFIPLLLFSLYMFYKQGILIDFINYAFGGLFNFGNSNFIISASPYFIVICTFTIAFYIYIVRSKKLASFITDEQKRNLNLLGCISIGMTFSVVPIVNDAHFLFVIPFHFILLFYFLNFSILKEFSEIKKFASTTKIIPFVIILFTLFYVIIMHLCKYNDYKQIKDFSNPFNNVYVSPEYYNKINIITKYIKNQSDIGVDVIIVASDSAFYSVPLNLSHGDFDLAFNGNLGYNGEKKMIEKIKNSEKTKFLIYTDEEDCFWQESKIVRNFIIENLAKTGELFNYSIYELEK